MFVERTFESRKPAAVKLEVSLNLFTANGSLCNGDANAFLESVVVFVSGKIEEIFGKFVISWDNVFEPSVSLEFFDIEIIEYSFVIFIHEY